MNDITVRPHAQYTLDQVADQFNDLADVRAVAFVSGYPSLLFPPAVRNQIQELGFVFIDIDGRRLQIVDQQQKWNKNITRKWGVLFLSLYNVKRQSSHSNVLLFDSTTHQVERFEPHGSNPQHASQSASEFQDYYFQAAMDQTVTQIVRGSGFTYHPPLARYPIFAQSLSRNDGLGNTQASPQAFERGARAKTSRSGDSFCSAWTLYYVLLRVINPHLNRLQIYSYLLGDRFIRSMTQMFAKQGVIHTEKQQDVSRGRWAADRIAGFIMYAHHIYQAVLKSPKVQAAIRQLD